MGLHKLLSLLISLVVSCSIMKSVWALSPPKPNALADEYVLEYLEGMIKAITKDNPITLPQSFKNADGTFKKVSLFNAQHEQKHHRSRKLQSTVSEPNCGGETKQLTVPEIPGISPAEPMNYQLVTTMTSACLWINIPYPSLNMNYNADTKQAVKSPIEITTGLKCTNCWAYCGAQVSMYLSCNALTLVCGIYFGTGGGLGFNFNIQINNPVFNTSTATATLLKLADTPIQLASISGITVTANPYASVTAQGLLSAQAVSSMTASFNTQAGFNMYAGLPGNPIGAGMTASVSLPQAQQAYSSYTSTTALSLNFTLALGIDWSIGYNLLGTGIDANMNTEFQPYYGYGYSGPTTSAPSSKDAPSGPTTSAPSSQDAPSSRRLGGDRRLASSSCSSNSTMVMEPAFKGFTLNLLYVPVTIAMPVPLGTITMSPMTTGTTCLLIPPPPSSSAKKGLSTGAKAGIAVGVICAFVVAVLVAFVIRRKYKPSLGSQDSSKDSTKSGDVEVTAVTASPIGHRV